MKRIVVVFLVMAALDLFGCAGQIKLNYLEKEIVNVKDARGNHTVYVVIGDTTFYYSTAPWYAGPPPVSQSVFVATKDSVAFRGTSPAGSLIYPGCVYGYGASGSNEHRVYGRGHNGF